MSPERLAVVAAIIVCLVGGYLVGKARGHGDALGTVSWCLTTSDSPQELSDCFYTPEGDYDVSKPDPPKRCSGDYICPVYKRWVREQGDAMSLTASP